MHDDEVHPAHEMAHAFLRTGPRRGPLFVVCCKYCYDDVDVRAAHGAIEGRSQAETRAGPYMICAKNPQKIGSLLRSNKQQQQARKTDGFDTRATAITSCKENRQLKVVYKSGVSLHTVHNRVLLTE